MSNTVQFPPIPVSILGLSDVEIVSVAIDRENEFKFKVISTKKGMDQNQPILGNTLHSPLYR